jgi:hypothetical protein
VAHRPDDAVSSAVPVRAMIPVASESPYPG